MDVDALPTVPISVEQLRQCKTTIRALIQHKVGHWFKDPVDPVAMGIPDYPLFVKNPMDLGTGRWTGTARVRALVLTVPRGRTDNVACVPLWP